MSDSGTQLGSNLSCSEMMKEQKKGHGEEKTIPFLHVVLDLHEEGHETTMELDKAKKAVNISGWLAPESNGSPAAMSADVATHHRAGHLHDCRPREELQSNSGRTPGPVMAQPQVERVDGPSMEAAHHRAVLGPTGKFTKRPKREKRLILSWFSPESNESPAAEDSTTLTWSAGVATHHRAVPWPLWPSILWDNFRGENPFGVLQFLSHLGFIPILVPVLPQSICTMVALVRDRK
ncbi:hypothetical protein DFH07DRAFT_771053 [Mycena maculata]|uniref:Uncharacterized protein n=1 Tax=Mycena maculata TaxID=230809 RepID=A0AAD7JFT6_9AGAR|nr:hypothetical protein DFH07DRAFT_771053 [Mycena maculata]